MRDQPIGTFLAELAARIPAPGGGAVAALHGAQAAALLAMVARYSDGPKYAADAELIGSVLAAADREREDCLELAGADAAAFAGVGAAYALPRGSDAEKSARSAAIADALVAAAGPPAQVVAAASRLMDLAEALLPAGNRNLITDVAAAAEAIRAAAATARVNVEVNLAGMTDLAARDRYRAALAGVDGLLDRAGAVTATVRAELAE